MAYCAKLIVVVAGDGLHHDAAEAGDGEQDELDKAEGEEFGEPVGGFGNGQRVVDAGEVRVALAPDQLGGVERGDDVEEELRAAFHGLQHEVGDRPDVRSGHVAGVVAVVDGDAGHQDDDAPERDFAQDIRDAQAGERDELRQGGSGAEDLVDAGELRRDQAAPWRDRGQFLLAGQGGAFAAGCGGQRLDRHGEELPKRDEREQADGAPQQAVIQEDAVGRSAATRSRAACCVPPRSSSA